jgi:hypothetical protein
VFDRISGGEEISPTAIPQLIDRDIYRKFFDGMLGSHEWTGQLYVSLCVSKTVTPIVNWSEAAVRIGLDAKVGARTAHTVDAQMRVSPVTFAEAVEHAKRALPRNRDFRGLESKVRALHRNPAMWFEPWRTATSPPRKQCTLPYAITWMWCEVAQGSLDSSPAWTGAHARNAKAAYRSFRAAMPLSAQRDLRSLVVPDLPA